MPLTTQDILQDSPRAIFTGDNLPVLRGMNSDSVDLIYLDPPFNSGKQWANPVEAAGRRAMAEFKDTWETSDIHIDERYSLGREYPAAVSIIDALAEVNGDSWKAYLIYMGVRLVEMRRILKPTGSIYYHCDPVMSHGVKLLMDAIFGRANFRNEIVWFYHDTPGRPKKDFARKHDILLRYSTDNNYFFNAADVQVPIKAESITRYQTALNLGGKATKTPESVWFFPAVKKNSRESTGYPTQKPMALLNRIIAASSKQGDIVLDPFCGCATTCLSAEKLGRHWIGIDLSEQAAKLVVARLQKESDRVLVSAADEIKYLRKAPQRTDLQGRRRKDGVLKPILYRTQGGKCPGCDREVESDFMDLDHIIAKSRGGQDIDENLQLLCRQCNVWKGDKGMDTLRKKVLQKRAERDMQKWREERDRKRKLEMETPTPE